ncbi:MAG TPA: Ig-like domain-containing protein [Ramlibacter sp.]|uniref:Ig-like domain-containing protein n=1 Tax=Ramlibacter sp. TaxID=1917967 RepID=UPI002BC9E0EE|nr:Ig-like domain-containing protein [Ramlibacter sp.]HVZ43899.1 Ig-like domain-containing protein [Ramlibacter sp.]
MREIVFIESDVADVALLERIMGEGREVHVLDAAANGVAKVASVLAERSGLEGIHLVTHGNEGAVRLGAVTLDDGGLDAYRAELESIGRSLAPGGDILLYGCHVGAGDGRGFVERFAAVTGADVAASDGPTGSSKLGGDWRLAVRSGDVRTQPAVSPELLERYEHVLSTGPTITNVDTSTADGSYKAGDSIVVLITFSEAVDVVGTPQLTMDTGALVNYVSGSGSDTLTFTYLVQAGNTSADLDTTLLSLNGGSIKDTATDTNDADLTLPSGFSLADNAAIVIDTTAPTVSNVASSSADGSYGVGSTIHVEVTFSEAVTVTGLPQITLETGTLDRYANYAAGTGTNTLTFDYVVQPGDSAADLDYASAAALALNGGTIKDAAGNAATLTLATPGTSGSLGWNQDIVVDTTAPSVSNVDSSSGDGSYMAGDTVLIQVTFSEAVAVTGTPELALDSGGTATYLNGTGTNTITFQYMVSGGETSSDLEYTDTAALTLAGGSIKDAAGNDADLTLASPGAAGSLGANQDIVIDTTVPTVTNVIAATPDGSYKAGDTIEIQVVFSEAVNVSGGTPTLALNSDASATAMYVSGSGSDTLTFEYTIGSGDASADLDYTATTDLALNGGTIQDAAGNDADLTLASPGAAGSLGDNNAIVVDTDAPNAPDTLALDSGSDSGASGDDITNDSTPTITGHAEPDSKVTLYDGVTVVGTVTADGTTGDWAITSTTLTDGGHTLTATATDAAGNTSTDSTGLTVTIDTIAPAGGSPDLDTASDTGSSSSDNITNLDQLSFSGTAETGATVQLYDGATPTGSPFVAAGGAWTIMTDPSLTAGSHSFHTTVTDTAGNVTTTAGLAVTIDLTNPAAPTTPDMTAATDSGSSNSDNTTKNLTPTFTGTAETGSTVTLYDTDGTTVLGTALAARGTWTITSSSLSEMSHTLTAKATDVAGNTGTASSGLTVTIDATAPLSPDSLTLDSTSDSGTLSDNITNDTTPTITGFAEAGATVTLYEGSIAMGSAVATGGAWSITTKTLSNGTHTLTAKAVDAAGNVSSLSTGLAVTIDSSTPGSPGAPDLIAADDHGKSSTDNLTNVTTPTFTGTAEANATVTLYEGVTSVGTGSADALGHWSITTSSTLSEGAHTLTAKATDAAGNTSGASTGLTVTIDTTAPAAPSAPDLATASDNGASSSDNVTSITTPTFTGTAAPGAAVTLYDGATAVGTATANASTGAWSIKSTTLSSGAHTMSASTTDNAGNTAASATTLGVTIVPSVLDVTSSNSNGAYGAGTNIFVQVKFSGSVDVTGTPTLTLETGTTDRTASYISGDGTDTLTFKYIVQAGDTSADLNYTTTAALTGTIQAGGADAVLTLPALTAAHSLGVNKNIVIDTKAPLAPSTPDMTAATDTGSSSTDNITGVTTPTFTGTAETGATVNLYDGVTLIGTGVATGGHWTITSSSLSLGAHSITASSSDAASNASPSSSALSVIVATVGTANNDSITGGAGNDFIDGAAGSDTMAGAGGNDTYIVNSALDQVQEGASAGTDTIDSLVTYTLPVNVENLVLVGTAAINGVGNGDPNQLTGNTAANQLTGGLGADTMTGGTGADTFIWSAVNQSPWGGNDTITDFKATEGDKLNLQAIDPNPLVAGDQKFTFIGTAAFSSSDATAQLRFDPGTHMLLGSTDADTDAEFAVLLTGVNALTTANITL